MYLTFSGWSKTRTKYIFPRVIEPQIRSFQKPNKVVVILGPRRVGKTFLIQCILESSEKSFVFLNGENAGTRDLFFRRTRTSRESMLDAKRFLVIDEAQKIPDVGNALKLMIDSIEGLTVLITMSSAFDVENHTGEPLTGRKTTFTLLGISEYACVQLFLEDLRPTGNRLD